MKILNSRADSEISAAPVLGEAFNSRIYDFTVKGFNKYYLGEIGVWIQNEYENKTTGSASPPCEKVLDEAFNNTENAAPDLSCFDEGTFVWTKHGLVEIQFLEPGLEVLSRDEKTGEIAYRKILKFFEHFDKRICDLVIQNQNEEVEFIYATEEHPFWVEGIGWATVSALQLGQRLKLATGASATIIDLKKTERKTTVYNLEVEEFHTYFVGLFGALVHNAKGSTELVKFLARGPNSTVIANDFS
ncbi:polymorphic toxin-type HINT domain-containing protein [Undibacterium sp. TJN19]|uniref:polymorphic toxin-type HINT domain-containing protein n=1 Tax=Undibacterium sp. TJN19 TaxID=3413055 RepID=UPI003BF36FE4